MTRKKRKLAYIRMKNRIRNGEIICVSGKVSGELVHNDEFMTMETQSHIKHVSRKFKLALEISTAYLGRSMDDFALNTCTWVLELKMVSA